MSLQSLLKIMENNYTQSEKELVQLAYDYANKAHKGQKRFNNEPYITHSIETAITLAEMNVDVNTLVAGLLHDVPEDTSFTLDDIKKNFGIDVANLVEGITKLGKVKYRGMERYIENFKKMTVAMAKDIRVILIKLADRLHNLKTLYAHTPEKQHRIALETMEIYAPLAGLLGIWRLKWQLEDECFKYLHPEEYKKIHQVYGIEKREEREIYINQMKSIIENEAKKEGIDCAVNGRFKHYYSIYKKMQRKDIDFNEVTDVFALRVIVDDIVECYKVLGMIHKLWKPVPNRFKDYIAIPKPNGYRALHTTIFGPEGKITEFQIRTREMDMSAKYGIAAHFHYKEHGSIKIKSPSWTQNILDLQKQFGKQDEEFVKNLKMDIFQDRIFVFTPKGDVIDLPEGSSVIDFAYRVHSNIGNHAMGAKINNKFDRLDTTLKSGDVVEIVLDKNRKHPSRDWIKIAKTSNAKQKIRKSLQLIKD